MNEDSIRSLRKQIAQTETLLQGLREQLLRAEQEFKKNHQIDNDHRNVRSDGKGNAGYDEDHNGWSQSKRSDAPSKRQPQVRRPFHQEEYARYGRQLIMTEIGLVGQLRLKHAKVLIVGVGGLGCPAATYLAGAGIGTLGLMDGDTVELSNLHRQIAHTTNRIGMSKVDSAFEYLKQLNPLVRYDRHNSHLSPEKAISVFEQYDVILDCTDHPTSRYLISDACVLAGKPLISASALKGEGQLIVLNQPPRPQGDQLGGPCYRCIFPKPPPADSVLSCGEGGILGPAVGVMGVLQALEAIKVICTRTETPDRDINIPQENGHASTSPSMVMFSAFSNPQFRTVRLRSRRKNCAVCSSASTITKSSISGGSTDYIAFCGVTAPVNILSPQLRISAKDFAGLQNEEKAVLIDVRDETQFDICALPHSINVPWTGSNDTWLDRATRSGALKEDGRTKYIICRFGNDSQLAVKAIMDHPSTTGEVKDVQNGFQSWREQVDPEWPNY